MTEAVSPGTLRRMEDEKGNPRDRSNSREHTDDSPYDATDQTIKKVLNRCGDSKTIHKMLKRLKHQSSTSKEER
jgi:hypothetical protein